MPEAPYCNTGVYPPSAGCPWASIPSQFDWYRATVADDPETVLQGLRSGLERIRGDELVRDTGTPRWAYKGLTRLLDRDGKRIAEVLYGGNPHPLVESSGADAIAVADVLRSMGPHRVSRCDVAKDGYGEGLWAEVRQIAVDLGAKHGLLVRCIDHPNDADAGCTVYLGSRQSEVMLRIYQRGLKLAADQGLRGAAITDDYRHAVRVELEFKPKDKTVKLIAGEMDPDALWGVSHAAHEFAERAFGMSVTPITIRQRRESDHERALRACAQQYSRHFEKLLRDCGGDRLEFANVLLDLANVDVETKFANPALQGRG